jgi:hypothetical protein
MPPWSPACGSCSWRWTPTRSPTVRRRRTQRRSNDAQKWSGKIESGKAVNLLPGEKAEMKTPGRPNPAVRSVLPGDVRAAGHGAGHAQGSAADALPEQLHRRARRVHDGVAPLEPAPRQGGQDVLPAGLELWLANEVERRAASRARASSPSKMMRAAWCEAMWTGDGPARSIRSRKSRPREMRVDMGISTLQAESIATTAWTGTASSASARRKSSASARRHAAARLEAKPSNSRKRRRTATTVRTTTPKPPAPAAAPRRASRRQRDLPPARRARRWRIGK